MLHVTLVLVLLAGLTVYMATRGSISEQRQSANEVRTQAAYQAATAGLEHAMAYFGAGGDVSLFPATGASAPAGGELARGTYRVQFCAPASQTPACPASAAAPLTCAAVPQADLRTPKVVACGWSDDGSATVQMVQRLIGGPVLPGTPTNPMVTYGTNNMLTGGGSILNYFNDLTVWSGGPVPSLSATGKTFVRDAVTDPGVLDTTDYRTVGNSPACNTPPAHYVCSSNGPVLGPDVVANDTALSSLSADVFFAKFMGASPAEYRASSVSFTVDPGLPASDSNATSVATLPADKRNNQVLWIEGNVTQLPDLGTQTAPTIVIINGNWNVTGSPVFNGLVYVRGQMSGTGSPTVYGALMANEVTVNGNVRVIYDPKVLVLAGQLGRAGVMPGSFRDWRIP